MQCSLEQASIGLRISVLSNQSSPVLSLGSLPRTVGVSPENRVIEKSYQISHCPETTILEASKM